MGNSIFVTLNGVSQDVLDKVRELPYVLSGIGDSEVKPNGTEIWFGANEKDHAAMHDCKIALEGFLAENGGGIVAFEDEYSEEEPISKGSAH